MNLFDIEEAKNQSNKKLRISELEKLIEKYQKSYYNGEAEISDSEFDSLWDELKILDPNNAILHKVGADSGNFAGLDAKSKSGCLGTACESDGTV